MDTLKNHLASNAALAGIGQGVVAAGLAFVAVVGVMYKADHDFARLVGPSCELRITDVNGQRQTIARSEINEPCDALAARVRAGDIPADYRAMWFELVPEE